FRPTVMFVTLRRYSLFILCVTYPAQICTLSLHDALPISVVGDGAVLGGGGLEGAVVVVDGDVVLRQAGHRLFMPAGGEIGVPGRSEEHTSELQSRFDLVCRLLLEKKNSNAALRGWCAWMK